MCIRDRSDHDHDNGGDSRGVQWKYTSSRIPRFNRDVSKHNPYLYYPLGYASHSVVYVFEPDRLELVDNGGP